MSTEPGSANALPTPTDVVPVLCSREAIQRYLEGFPAWPAAAGDVQWSCPTPALPADVDAAAYDVARQLRIPALRAPDLQPDAAALSQITPATARRLGAVPILLHKNLLAMAIEDAGDASVMQELNFICKYTVVPLVAPARSVRERIGAWYDRSEDLSIVAALGLDPKADVDNLPERTVEQLAQEQPVVRLVSDLIVTAAQRRASDIHLRPSETATDVLFRIDGELVQVRRLMPALSPAVISRIKVIGGMNLAERRRPQDGRASHVLDDGRRVDLRMSVVPTSWGESAAIRLLDTRQSLWTVEQLGLAPRDRLRFDDVISRSHGMFLCTGPTGCGKSTTLYAMLQELRRQRINILTIEDPVEFNIEGVQQVQVNRAADVTFASALRNFLRHDPDAIMVGEIRDRETAGIAVESALTGHLVLSTLHTNTATTTVTRMLDLGVEAYLLRSSLLAVMAQRLVRLNCRHCAQPEHPDPRIRDALEVGADEAFLAGRGCSQCDDLGVRGRRAVYELMEVSQRIRKLIVPGADADLIHAAAIEEGMTPITHAAVALARQGLISLAEAWRVRAE
ncbi:MAG: type II/IV secretion system protein [Proteobacteria bacterium]|nr:type II/IV secretion system protein [Pseudomonadota bacterium]